MTGLSPNWPPYRPNKAIKINAEGDHTGRIGVIQAMQCQATTQSGRQCRKQATNGKEFCVFHDPEYRPRINAGASKGGKHRSPKYRLSRIKATYGYYKFKDVSDIEQMLTDCLNKLLLDEIDHQKSNAVARLAITFLKCRELEQLRDIETRLQELERSR